MPKLKPGTIIPTPEEDAIITAAAMADPDSGYLTEEEWEQMKPHAFLGKDFHKYNKIPISIRLDKDVLEHFKAGGAGWQGRINDALKALMLKEAPAGVRAPESPPYRHKK